MSTLMKLLPELLALATALAFVVVGSPGTILS